MLAVGRRSLENATLYSTAEPCILCGFAIRETRIRTVVVSRPSGDIGSVRSRFPVLTADWVDRWGAPPEVIWWQDDDQAQVPLTLPVPTSDRLRLDPATTAAPPADVRPVIEGRGDLPADVKRFE